MQPSCSDIRRTPESRGRYTSKGFSCRYKDAPVVLVVANLWCHSVLRLQWGAISLVYLAALRFQKFVAGNKLNYRYSSMAPPFVLVVANLTPQRFKRSPCNFSSMSRRRPGMLVVSAILVRYTAKGFSCRYKDGPAVLVMAISGATCCACHGNLWCHSVLRLQWGANRPAISLVCLAALRFWSFQRFLCSKLPIRQ